MAEEKAWGDMSPAERESAVRRLMAEGGTNKSVAKALGTTPGTIAGFRFKKGIPSTNEPRGGKPRPEAPAPAPRPQRQAAPAERQEPSRMLKLAASEATQCIAVDKFRQRCAYEKEAGSDYCGLPQHQALKTRARR